MLLYGTFMQGRTTSNRLAKEPSPFLNRIELIVGDVAHGANAARFNHKCTCSGQRTHQGRHCSKVRHRERDMGILGQLSCMGQAYTGSKGPNHAFHAQGTLLAQSSQDLLLDKNRLLTCLISSIIYTLEEKRKKESTCESLTVRISKPRKGSSG